MNYANGDYICYQYDSQYCRIWQLTIWKKIDPLCKKCYKVREREKLRELMDKVKDYYQMEVRDGK